MSTIETADIVITVQRRPDSGKEIAKLLAEELGEDAIYGENIAVQEQKATQTALNDAEADMQEELMVAAEQGL